MSFRFFCSLKSYIVCLLVFKYFAQLRTYHSSCIQWRITWVTLQPTCRAECQVTFAPSCATSSDRMIWDVLYEFKKGVKKKLLRLTCCVLNISLHFEYRDWRKQRNISIYIPSLQAETFILVLSEEQARVKIPRSVIFGLARTHTRTCSF